MYVYVHRHSPFVFSHSYLEYTCILVPTHTILGVKLYSSVSTTSYYIPIREPIEGAVVNPHSAVGPPGLRVYLS